MVKLSENVWPLLIGRRSNLVIIREAKLRKRRRTSSLKFLPWNTNFPWKEASIRITRVCFHQRNLKFFTDKTWKNGTEDFSDDEYLIRFRTQENALTEEFGDVYVAWIDTYRRYTCTLPLHRARDVKEKFCSCIYMGRTLGQNRGIIVFVEKNYRREF